MNSRNDDSQQIFWPRMRGCAEPDAIFVATDKEEMRALATSACDTLGLATQHKHAVACRCAARPRSAWGAPPSRPSGASFAAVELMYTPRVYTLLLLAGETAPSYFLMMEFASGGDLMGPPSIPSHGPFLLLALPRPALRRAHLNATGQAWFTIAAVRALEGSLLATMHSTTGGKGALKIRPKSRFSQACCTAPSP